MDTCLSILWSWLFLCPDFHSISFTTICPSSSLQCFWYFILQIVVGCLNYSGSMLPYRTACFPVLNTVSRSFIPLKLSLIGRNWLIWGMMVALRMAWRKSIVGILLLPKRYFKKPSSCLTLGRSSSTLVVHGVSSALNIQVHVHSNTIDTCILSCSSPWY